MIPENNKKKQPYTSLSSNINENLINPPQNLLFSVVLMKKRRTTLMGM